MAEAMKKVPAEQLPEVAWDFAAGRTVAEKTRVLGCEDETLMVEVPDANWRTQLYSMVPQLVARLNQITRVKRIEFKLARPQDERRGK